MVRKREKEGPTAQLLRAAGYRPLPRLWVTEDEFQLVRYMARKHFDDINALRTAAAQERREAAGLTKEEEMELAWKQMGK